MVGAPTERVRRLQLRFLTPAGNQIAVPVTETATSVAITFERAEVDTSYGVVATPSWGTTVFVSSKATTGCTIEFGTAAPADATVDLITFRSE